LKDPSTTSNIGSVDAFRHLLLTMPLAQVLPWILALNVTIFVLSVSLGEAIVRALPNRRVCTPNATIERYEWVSACVTVLLNTLVTFAGLALHRRGMIVFRTDTGLRAWADVIVLLLAMDLAMYVFHRVAHVPAIFALVHRPHHRYERPRPIDLFVMSPQENLGFGALWLALLCIYPASWLGMSIYLVLNTTYGSIGHLGVEPFPNAWVRIPGVRWIATSTFHALHHLDGSRNFGFYTLFWDRLFGTLSPRYVPEFGRSLQ